MNFYRERYRTRDSWTVALKLEILFIRINRSFYYLSDGKCDRLEKIRIFYLFQGWMIGETLCCRILYYMGKNFATLFQFQYTLPE